MVSSSRNLERDEAIRTVARTELDGLALFRPVSPRLPGIHPDTPDQEAFFLDQNAKEILVRGAKRGGKTMCAAARFAAIARDMPIRFHDGTEHHIRLPHQRGRHLTMWVIGLNLDHIGKTIHRVLFEPRLFKIIRDEFSGWWRAYQPWSKGDNERSAECKFAPPLIPEHCLNPDGKGWYSRAEKQFTKMEVWNPDTKELTATIYAFAGSQDVRVGDPVDEIWYDERMRDEGDYAELLMRLMDYEGRMCWSAASLGSSVVMQRITQRSKQQLAAIERGERKEPPTTAEWFFRIKDNPYMNRKEIELRGSQMTEWEKAVHIDGDYFLGNVNAYPFFDEQKHAAIPDDREKWDDLAKVLFHYGGFPPPEWTHELILDPGTVKPAVLLAAIPPRFWSLDGEMYELWATPTTPYFVPYMELYSPGSPRPAGVLAKLIRENTKEGVRYLRWVIDARAGKQTAMSWDVSVQTNYERAMREAGLTAIQTVDSFVHGSDDWNARSGIVTQALLPLQNGRPQIRIVGQNCPNLVKQMTNLKKQTDGDQIKEKKAPNQDDDLTDCLEYWLSVQPQYVGPNGETGAEDEHELMESMRERYFQSRNTGRNQTHIGPPPSRPAAMAI